MKKKKRINSDTPTIFEQHATPIIKKKWRGSSTDQALGLLFNGHEFKFSQDHWRLI